MEGTPRNAAVISTIDEVLDALAAYPERDAAIEQLELRINADRSRLVAAGSPAAVELVEKLAYYEHELRTELAAPSDGIRAAALEDIRDVLLTRLRELIRPEAVANPVPRPH